jgi:hypothetical protein
MAISGDLSSSLAPGNHARRFEIRLAVGLIAFGLLVLPAVIYFTGSLLLGTYGGGGHLGSFYGDYFRDLARAPQTWALALGPYVLVQLARLVFRDFSRPPAGEAQVQREADRPAPADATRERREPTIKL